MLLRDKPKVRQYERVLCTLALAVSIVAFMSSCAFAGKGIDLDNWTEERIKLSELELVFRVPGGQREDVPPFPTIRRVDLDRDLTNEKPVFAVYDHTWAFDVGFWKGVMGTLGMVIGVGRRPNDYAADLTSLENLQELIKREFDRRYTERNERLRREGQERFIVMLPETYKRVTIRQREWLMYSYSISSGFNRTRYSTPLAANSYLTVSLDFVDNSRGYKTNWRQEAQEVADKIAASLEIR
jgi:hypothetical protein